CVRQVRVETVRIQGAVAQVFEQAPVILVGSGSGGKRNDAAAGATPFRGVSAGQDLEFLYCVDLRNVRYPVEVVHRRVRGPIQQILWGRRVAAVDTERIR